MTSPPDRLADLTTTVTAQRGQITRLNNLVKDLRTQVDDLTRTVTDTLDAASPKGPPVTRWDTATEDERARKTEALHRWVTQVLIPRYVTGRPWTLHDCWDQHPPLIIELDTLWWAWKRIYDSERPGPGERVLEFANRWLPETMARVTAASRRCEAIHQPDPA